MSLREVLSAQPELSISDPRQMTVQLHAYLRELILANVFPAGTELKQAELARIFAVSRTPLREALRMLQEEGLVAAEPNQRSRVVGLDLEQLDSLYAVRISLESLGIRLTAGHLTRAELRGARGCLLEMERTYRANDLSGWAAAHRRFHLALVAKAGETVLRTISSYAEMTDRYVRLEQVRHRENHSERHAEHVALLDAVRAGDSAAAVRLLIEHLAGAATRVIGEAAPGRGTPAVQAAVELVTGAAFGDGPN
jgi:DNA-binding GntR family transcriptional regulator